MTMKIRGDNYKYRPGTFKNSLRVHISENEKAAAKLRLLAKEYARCKFIQDMDAKVRAEEAAEEKRQQERSKTLTAEQLEAIEIAAAEEHNKQQKNRMLGGYHD